MNLPPWLIEPTNGGNCPIVRHPRGGSFVSNIPTDEGDEGGKQEMPPSDRQ
jgi:hypothetical protein